MSIRSYGRKNPFFAKIKQRQLLSQKGSTKETYHLVLDLSGSNLHYKVGDAIAVLPANPKLLVEEFLAVIQKTGEEVVLFPRLNSLLKLREIVETKIDLVRSLPSLLKLLAVQERKGDLAQILQMEDRHKKANYLANAYPAKLLATYSGPQLPLQELLSVMAPLLPRFYSVASSASVVGEEVHLLVATFHYQQGEVVRTGIGSNFLCHQAEVDSTPIPIYVQPTAHFTLPENPLSPILMIGPGTGVAPYRGFLQQRMHDRAKGENWLIFGERNYACDYYYQAFFQELEEKRFLQLSTAFSRDQKEKIYVQHRLLDQTERVWKWLERGAYVYICGDKRFMGKAVQESFYTIVEKAGGHAPLEAKAYIKELRRAKRFLLDIY